MTILILAVTTVKAQITGAIIDAETGDSIPNATVRYKGHKITVKSNAKGIYTISRHEGWKITVSVVGYKSETISVSQDTPKHMDVRLIPDDTKLDELVVSSKSSKYSRKGNPAVEFMKRVIAAKKNHKLENKDYYSVVDYQKVKFAVNDVSPESLEKGAFKKYEWLKNQVEPCFYNNKLIVPLLVEEKVTRDIYRKDPKSKKSIVMGSDVSGLNDMFETGEVVNTMIKDVFSTIDIYDDQIRLLRKRFTSPIGKDAIAFYRFYIVDTLKIDNDSCVHLTFLPNNQQDFGFRGDIYIVNDSALNVKKVELGIPKSSDVNFIDNMLVKQEFVRLSSGEWVLKSNDLFIEMQVTSFFGNFAVIRESKLSDYRFDPIPEKEFKIKGDEKVLPDADQKDSVFWAKYRNMSTTSGGNTDAMAAFFTNLQKIKGFGWAVWVLKAFVENFIETCPPGGKSKFDIGPVNTLASFNDMDGFRMRIGGVTTANLNPHLFFKGYYAHGFKTEKNYYKADVTYSFNKKKYSDNEFPRRHISVSSSYDICSPTDRFVQTDKDNMFTSLKWNKASKMMLYNSQKIELVREQENGVKMETSLKFEENEATGGLFFKSLSDYDNGGFQGGTWEDYYTYNPDALHNGKIRTTELNVALEFSPGAKFFNTKQRQMPLNKEAPVFRLSHTFGFKGFGGGQYKYHVTEAKIFKRFFLKSWGILNCTLNAGKQWAQVPYPLLIAPAANMSFIITNETFNLVNNSEFMNDRYASLFLTWEPHGKFFNRIPYIRHLKWREYIGVRTLWGGLSEKNNPNLQKNWNSDVLMAFPQGYYHMNTHIPYMEGIIGIHNIFRFFSADYVYRFNYHDNPESKKQGVRFSVKFSF